MAGVAGAARSQVRVLLAVGDRERERALTRDLAHLDVTVIARCLDAPSLQESPLAFDEGRALFAWFTKA